MLDPNFLAQCALHNEAIRREASGCLLCYDRRPMLSREAWFLPAMGDLLIRFGHWLKDRPRRLESEPASLSTLTIIL
jgi:hypothetical protein